MVHEAFHKEFQTYCKANYSWIYIWYSLFKIALRLGLGMKPFYLKIRNEAVDDENSEIGVFNL